MSYNTVAVHTLHSTLKITPERLKQMFELYEYELPEECSLRNLDDSSVNEITKVRWSGMGSGNVDTLKRIFVDLCTGTGDFVMVWEDGDLQGLKVTEKDGIRTAKYSKVIMELGL